MFKGFGIFDHSLLVLSPCVMPHVNIIIPTYNRAGLIGQTLDSVCQQTFPNWECFIVDDHSTDNTKKIVEAYCERDSRFHYLVNEGKKGAQGARNTGMLHANSDWIIFFDSDNVMKPHLLERLFTKTNKNADVITCWSNIIDSQSNKRVGLFNWVSEGNIHSALLQGKTYVDTNAALIRKICLEKINGWSEDCPSFQEWDLHIRLSQIASYTTIREPLIDYYVNGSDTISKDKKREVEGYLYILSKFKKDWKSYPEQYLQYGIRVLDILYSYNNRLQLYRLLRLFPQLRINYFKHLTKLLRQSIKQHIPCLNK